MTDYVSSSEQQRKSYASDRLLEALLICVVYVANLYFGFRELALATGTSTLFAVAEWLFAWVLSYLGFRRSVAFGTLLFVATALMTFGTIIYLILGFVAVG